ncbi:uncharacterized protein B0H64DRAFT_453814 [Chaetomium fimeti]|uniref:Phosphoribosylaminoimidazole-succinocarboxamide synthase n=1 Tax=Chaetomium fimeti TaxID=1854472 RepID=A0AAE0HMR7_9PEZI|nr:hypothetical protein B0H64DRAFT_453814 [Chaetomium fimeti]
MWSSPHTQTQQTAHQSAHQTAAPYTPSPPSPSESGLQGQNGVFGPPTIARSYGRPVVVEGPYRRVPSQPPLPAYQPPAWETTMNPPMATDFRDELARIEGVITPGVDNTPFIQYAIEALHRDRDRDTGYSVDPSGSGSSSSGLLLAPGHRPESYQPRPADQQPPRPSSLPSRPAAAHPHAEDTRTEAPPHQLPRPFIPGPRESAHSLAESLLKKGPRPAQPHEWRPVEMDELLAGTADVPPLTFRPWPLRAPALFVFMALCVLMIGALILSAVYSHLHQGLLEWATIHGGRYFLFRVLPQLIAACMLLYAQFLITTIFRMLPFVKLASEAQEEREGALFQEMYPSFLRPRLVGPWNVWVPILVTWLMSFTIPLQSSLFTAVLVDQSWKWATVQGVAWTLVALYLALLASTIIVWRYWANLENTGLIWDPRSLADIAALVSETNTADDYLGTQLARGRDGIRFALRHRAADRLCYWTWKDGRHGVWHTLGSAMDEANPLLPTDPTGGQRMQRHDEKQPYRDGDGDHADADADLEASPTNNTNAHRKYLPFALRTSPLLLATLTAGGVLPWASLTSNNTPNGAPAEPSLLADYAACGPGQVTLRALRNGHWRVAAVSLVATLSVLIPVLAGASFMALTTRAGDVRMFANMPAFGVMLGLLLLYVAALAALLPARGGLRMPHGVTCLGEVLGYLVGVEMREEAALKRCVSRREMAGRMGVGRGLPAAMQTRWVFGFGEGVVGSGAGAGAGGVVDGELGVRRVRRFTEKRKVRKSQIRRPFV